MAALKLGDIYLGKDSYLIVRHGKGDKERTVYIDDNLADHLSSFYEYKSKTLKEPIKADSPLFTGQAGKQCPPITLMKSFKVACKIANLRSTLSIHKCRHTYATFLLQSCSNLRYVQNQLGHSDISMTALYASILPEDNSKLANSIINMEEV